MEQTTVLQAEEIEELVGRFGTILFRFSLVTLGNASDAEDAVQETFIRYVQKRPVLKDEEHVRAWLLKVCRNKCMDILRWRNRHQTVDIDEVAAYTGKRESSGIFEALARLPEKYRTVLLLYYVEDYRAEEIAKVIDRTTSAVKMRLKKGRLLLKEAYEEMEEFQ